MWKNRSPKTVVPETDVEHCRAYMVEIETEIERLADLAHQMGVELNDDEVYELELELRRAEELYWEAVDRATNDALMEIEGMDFDDDDEIYAEWENEDDEEEKM
jgi:hypothetical protein